MVIRFGHDFSFLDSLSLSGFSVLGFKHCFCSQFNENYHFGYFGGGDIVFPEKPKRERVQKKSVVGRANYVNEDMEMGCSGTYGSQEEEEQQL